MFHGDLKMTGQSPYDTSKVTGAVKWKFKTESGVETSPVIDNNGTVYIADHSCRLYAVNSDGTKKWEFKAGDPVVSKEWGGYGSCFQSTPALAPDGTIYLLPMSGNLYAVSPDGKEKWRYPIFTFKNAWPSPIVGPDGTIYAGSEIYPPRETGKPQEKGSYFYALNPDGTLKWKYDATGAAWVNPNASIADDGTLYISSNDCKHNCDCVLLALNPDGSVKWKFYPPNGVMEGAASIGADGSIYFTAKGKTDPRLANFYALNPDGTLKWKFSLSQGVSITPGISKDGKIYFGDWGGVFYALDLNGKELWRVQTPLAYETLSSSPAIGADGTIYFGAIAGYFYAYTPEGKEKWKINVGEAGVVSSPAIGADGTVYFATVRGELYALGTGKFTEGQTATAQSQSTGSQSGQKPQNVLAMVMIVLAIAAFAAIASLILVLFLKRQTLQNKPLAVYLFINKYRLAILPAYLVLLATFIFFAFFWRPKSQTAAESAKTTVSPQSQTESRTNSRNIDKKSVCPRRVYGHPSTGYYGIYGMQQIDMTSDEYQWAHSNCPDTVWADN